MCYNDDDKILVTAEDNLPIVEVDESYSGSSLQVEFDWLMKVVAASWDTARLLKQDLEKLSELSSVHLKHQLLTAVLQLQVRVCLRMSMILYDGNINWIIRLFYAKYLVISSFGEQYQRENGFSSNLNPAV